MPLELHLEIPLNHPHTRVQVRQSTIKFTEIFYNRKRRYVFLNYITPVENEENTQVI
jgi:hypothetical protein